MKSKPIEQARNADLRGSLPALQRAAQRARAIAAQTGTAIVISRQGVLEHLYPTHQPAIQGVQEETPPYQS